MATVLVVDDEPDLLALLDFNLRQEGFETLLAASGDEALRLLRRRVPDLVVLDLMLPDVSGTEVFRAARSDPRTAEVPIVMLTAKAGELDRVVGLELGADDYVTKPFSVRELLLRIRAVLRRARREQAAGAGRASETLGPLRLDLEAHRAFVSGREVELTPIEFRLLQLLMARVGRVQSRLQLLEGAWEAAEDVDARAVDTQVKRLREKLGPARELLETVRGVGYRLVDPAERD